MIDLVIYVLLWLALRKRSGGDGIMHDGPAWNARWPLHVPATLTQGSSARHRGVDITPNRRPPGSQSGVEQWVYPIFVGVVRAITHAKTGNWVSVQHGEVTTVYGHLASVSVHVGERVVETTPLGLVGADPQDPEHIVHVHLQAFDARGPIKPESLLNAHEGDSAHDGYRT